MSRILVIVAHPDDETLGCGGTIQKFREQGALIKVLCLTSKGLGHERDHARVASFQLACDFLQVEGEVLNLSNEQLDTIAVSKLDAEYIRPIVNSFDPEIIITHDTESPNQHHAKVGKAAEIAGRIVDVFYTFMLPENIPRCSGWEPNMYCYLSEKHVTNKAKAFLKYDQDKGDAHIRSYEGIKIDAEYVGRTLGVKYAEAFKIKRFVI